MSFGNDSALMQTIRAELKDATSQGPRNAILVQIYPTCLNMGVRYPLDGKPLDIGRGEGCDLRINHASVSRRHARIKPMPDGYCIADLDSTNGTFLNDALVKESPLKEGDYLRIGSCIFRFLTGNNLEAEYHEAIYRLTIVDGLTEVYNKRYFLEFLGRELARAERHQRPLSLVLFDIDHFKRINDERGHLCGDHTLRLLAGRVKASLREEELMARYGGEEFAVVLPETSQEDAAVVAERIRNLIGTTLFEYDQEVYPVTVSLGVATSVHRERVAPEELIRLADEALYDAKRSGRNRVCCYDRETSAVPPSLETRRLADPGKTP